MFISEGFQIVALHFLVTHSFLLVLHHYILFFRIFLFLLLVFLRKIGESIQVPFTRYRFHFNGIGFISNWPSVYTRTHESDTLHTGFCVCAEKRSENFMKPIRIMKTVSSEQTDFVSNRGGESDVNWKLYRVKGPQFLNKANTYIWEVFLRTLQTDGVSGIACDDGAFSGSFGCKESDVALASLTRVLVKVAEDPSQAGLNAGVVQTLPVGDSNYL